MKCWSVCLHGAMVYGQRQGGMATALDQDHCTSVPCYQVCCLDMSGARSRHPKRIVGFAISPEKVCLCMIDQCRNPLATAADVPSHLQAAKHLTAHLLQHASSVGIEIRAIDPNRPVAEQGPFDLILQKCRDAGQHSLMSPFTYPLL